MKTEGAAEFYLSVFPEAKKVEELRSSGVGPWPAGKIATITIEDDADGDGRRRHAGDRGKGITASGHRATRPLVERQGVPYKSASRFHFS